MLRECNYNIPEDAFDRLSDSFSQILIDPKLDYEETEWKTVDLRYYKGTNLRL